MNAGCGTIVHHLIRVSFQLLLIQPLITGCLIIKYFDDKTNNLVAARY